MNKLILNVQDTNGTWSELKYKPDLNAMQVITAAKLDMDASCDGECACSTCHVLVDEAWLPRLEPQSEDEEIMIDYTSDPQPTSRLACQIKLTEELDGLKMTILGK